MDTEPTVNGIRQPVTPDGPMDRAVTSGLGALVLLALVAMAVGLQYQIRLWALVVGVVFCPASLIARIVVGRYALITFITSVGVGVAGLMIVGQAMLVAHAWYPVAAAYAILIVGLGAATWLLRERWLPWYRGHRTPGAGPSTEQIEDADR